MGVVLFVGLVMERVIHRTTRTYETPDGRVLRYLEGELGWPGDRAAEMMG